MGELVSREIGDGTVIHTPEVVNIPNPKFFDEFEYELWQLFLKYAEYFGIEVENDSEVDWAVVKEVQDAIIDQFRLAGVSFKFH